MNTTAVVRHADARTLNHILIVFIKELLDALRDRRTLTRMVLPGILVGPLMLFGLSSLIAQFETQFEKREVHVYGAEHGPTLLNYIERQNYRLVKLEGNAMADAFEKSLRSGTLGAPVLVIPPQFEAELARGDQPTLEVVTDSANTRAQVGVGAVAGLVRGFGQERAQLALMLRGVSPELTQPVQLTERDLASPGARATRITSIVPFALIMPVLYGCLAAALDATSGERERGSLEPLLTNPASHHAITLGKWFAVVLMGAAVAALSAFGFLPAQWLIKSDALAAQFRFGWQEASLFAALLAPLAVAAGGVLMAMAIRTKTFKEAQASANLVLMVVGFLPLIPMLNPGADAAWHYWVPGLAQYQQMMLVLKGEALGLDRVLPALLSALGLAAASLWYVAREMRAAAAR
ncbi:ABC transporter permease [Inhella sp.]|uniref:ABC transporter permease n=1 Tax=Inhella sp. TaxID=1921806 RepID=UPI0035B0C06E